DQDAFQCGYCTPGQICSAVALLNEGRVRTADDIRELMSGNICRCGAYPNIVAAIQQAMQSGGRRAAGILFLSRERMTLRTRSARPPEVLRQNLLPAEQI